MEKLFAKASVCTDAFFVIFVPHLSSPALFHPVFHFTFLGLMAYFFAITNCILLLFRV